MNHRTRILCTALMLLPAPLVAQQRKPDVLNGVWHEVEIRVIRPDSTVTRPARAGMSIIHNGRFSQFYLSGSPAGVQQAGVPTSVEQKAARYDALAASAGRLELTDSTVTIHWDFSKNPAQMGTTTTVRYRIVADSFWETVSSRWGADTSKNVQTIYKYVRER